jgi:TolB-like protein
MLKKPNQTERRRSEPTSISHHPSALIFSFVSLSGKSSNTFLARKKQEVLWKE